MNPLHRHMLALITALMVFAASVSAALELSQAPIETYAGATWNFIAIVLTLIGLLVSPVIIVSAGAGLIAIGMQSATKHKRKRHE